MSSWILQHFLNPALFWPGLLLLSAPIIIHLINRMRYRRVRFAAMEFLLASQRRSRRRILLEQILLLLLRLSMVILIVALMARLILNPQQMSLFQGARTHHIVVIDDSASMRDRVNEGTAFDVAQETVRRIAAEGARRPGTQMLSLMLMSDPDRVVSGFSERVVDEPLLTELTERLATMPCSHQTVDPAKVLEAVHRRLIEERSTVRTVHVLSDFRRANWIDNKAAIAALKSLEGAKIGVNLVRSVDEGHENLGIDDLGGAVEVAAAGVPVSLSACVRNWGTRAAQNVSGSIFIDGARLPRTIDFQTIPPGQTATRRFDVIFDSAQPHTVKMTLADDALDADNQRFLAVDVPVENPVLIVDGSPAAEQATYIADALAADRSVTGFAPDVRSVEDLRRVALDNYDLIYLINVPELAPDAVAALEKYVREGGGLIWYMGDAVRPAFYNEKLFSPDGGLFPVRLGMAPLLIERTDPSQPRSGIEVEADPLFTMFKQQEVPILDQVFINLLYPVAPDAPQQPSIARDVQILARLGNEPLMCEQKYGAGHIFTCLTSAGPLVNPEGVNWSNWANGPAGFSFVVLQLDLAKRMIRKDRAFPQLATGTPIEIDFSQTVYQPELEILTPDDQVTRLQASRETGNGDADGSQLHAAFRETDEPGVYGVTLLGQDQQASRRLYAMNVPSIEGSLQLADDDALLRELGPETNVKIQQAGSFEWIRSESPGSEVRWFLLVALAIACILEQFLAARLSYQSAV
ncbi:BatA domain-containing protein [Planctomicrobium piriforme]|uniref:N-terminal double-transmembrane domain-containing protein n=1 Tax=Planctomicrobium piriforme TaxID=1576369 RepID=A0A1I3JDS2_9PLAN|nr:BatA domain-containing protein [Planctomicrobium piriforme]SFI58098.1 N-terminal double-transmembrane domain-containing protein [Planctomicrobium piriforme]